MKYAHLHRRAYSLPKHLTLADIVVGVVGFEPTQPEGTAFTVQPTSPTVAHSHYYIFVGLPGLEPGLSEPKSDVTTITP